MKRALFVTVFLISASACYHAQIQTGLPPGPQTIERPWAHGWLYGLVPPSTIQTMQECPNGVARVETQLSFVNQLANFLTGGIYTPMSIIVTCAAGRDQARDAAAALPTIYDAETARTAIRRRETFLIQTGGSR